MHIVIVSKSPYPEGNASSAYIRNVCKIFVACGHRVTVLGCYRGVNMNYPVEGELEGVKYYNFDATKHSKIVVFLYDNFFEKYIVNKLRKINNPNIVFLFGGDAVVADKIHKFCKKRNIQYGGFNCEWFEKSNFTNELKNEKIEKIVNLVPYNAKNSDRAILISTLLYDYFKNNKVNALRIPNVIDIYDEKWKIRKNNLKNDIIKIAYTGVPGIGKDELGIIVQAIEKLPEDKKNKIKLHIYGPSQQQLNEYLLTQGIKSINDNIICHGHVDQNRIPAILNECHYSILIRKPSLRTNAGFSTKFVESFAAGVPMIANITGDMGEYLTNDINGVVVKNETIEACTDALCHAYEIREKNNMMRVAAFKTAKDKFDYRNYIDQTKKFLEI